MAFQHTVGDWSVYLDETADAFYYYHQKTRITTWIRPNELGGPESESDEEDDQPPPPPADEPGVALPVVATHTRRLSALEVLNNPLSPGKAITSAAPKLDQKTKDERAAMALASLSLKVQDAKSKRGSLSALVIDREQKNIEAGNKSSSSTKLLSFSESKERESLCGPLTASPMSPSSSSPKRLEVLQDVFAHPIALEHFTRFAMQQRCSENILFWQKAEEYYHEVGVSAADRKERAIVLLKNFLKAGAPFEINCARDEVQRIEALISEGGSDLHSVFVGLQTQIFSELSRATYANFKKSPLFTQATTLMASPQAQESERLKASQIISNSTVVVDPVVVSHQLWQNACLGPGPCTRRAGRNLDLKSVYNKSDYCLKHQYLSMVDPFKVEADLEAAHRVATELLTSEGSYREGLRAAYQGFYLHLKVRLDMGRPKMSKSAVARVFMNLEELYRHSCDLHDDLQAMQSDRVLVRQLPALMLYYAPAFQRYRLYLEGYDDSIRKLNRERTKTEKFNSWLTLHERVEGVQLPSLLIMPVQRLPRYTLLLKEFKKFLPESSNLHYDLDSAISKLSETISTINAALSLRDQLRRLQEIEEQFDKTESDFIPFAEKPEVRRLILQGDLMRPEMVRRRKSIFSSKETDQTTQTKFHFFLFSDLLIYAIGQGNRMFKYKMRGCMPLTELSVEKDTLFDDNQINISDAKGKRFKIRADDTASRDMWFAALSTAIETINDGLPLEFPSVVLGKAA